MCQEYYDQGMTISGNYEIDPDGQGGDPPFPVHCDFERGKQYHFLNKCLSLIFFCVYWNS